MKRTTNKRLLLALATALAAPALTPAAIVAEGSVSWHDIADEHKLLPPFLQNVQMPEGG